jgi:hypothetical protein
MLEASLRTRSRERSALLARMDDGFSDLDVVVAALTSSPRARFAAAVAAPLLVVEAPQNAPDGGAFLSTFVPGSEGPHGIDWIWRPLSTSHPPPDCRLLFDRRTASGTPAPPVNTDADRGDSARTPFEATVHAACSFWAMLLWSAKGVARWPDSSGMPLLRYVEADLRQIEEYTGSGEPEPPSGTENRGVDKVRVLRGHADHMQRLSPILADAGIVLPPRLIGQVKRLLEVVEAAVRANG